MITDTYLLTEPTNPRQPEQQEDDPQREPTSYEIGLPYTRSSRDERFETERAPANHSPTHTGEAPFACAYCNKPFAHGADAARHELLRMCHRDETGLLTALPGPSIALLLRASSDRARASSSKALASSDEVLASSAETFASSAATSASSDEALASSDEFLASSAETFASSAKTFASSDGAVASRAESFASSDRGIFRGFACDVCGDCHSTEDSLKRHAKTHGTVQPNARDVYEKAFERKSRLDEQRFIGTGKKYACGDCGLQFDTKAGVMQHIKNKLILDSMRIST